MADLPPRPDQVTGEPRPPHAPLPPGWRAGRRAGRPVAGALEWHAVPRSTGVLGGLAVSVVVFVFLTVRDSGLDWTGTWWLWLFVLPYPLLGLLRGRQPIAAGADWLRVGRAEVALYQLIEIRLRSRTSDPYLELTDATGRGLAVTLTSLQRNRKLWDLVYNGLRHSAASGTGIDEHTSAWLRPPG